MTVAPASPTVAFASTTATRPLAVWRPNTSIGAALAEDRERDLDVDVPVVVVEQADDLVYDGCVTLVDQTIERSATPPNAEIKLRVKSRHHVFQVVVRDPTELALLDPPDNASRHAGPLSEVDLSPAATQAKCPNGAPDPEAIHQLMIA